MASVWLERKGEKPKKLGSRLHPVDAIKLWKHQLDLWKGKACECPSQAFHAMLHHPDAKVDAKLGPWGLIYIEFNSPPSAPEKGQPCRRKVAKS